MRNIIVAIVLLASFGCSSLPKDPMWQAELGWQVMHGVDVLQTINGPARDDCFYESNYFTSKLIGENPSTGEVIAWGFGAGAIHWGVSKTLDHFNAKPWVKVAWQGVTLTTKATTLVHNHNEGIRPWGNNVSDCNGR